MAVALFLVMLYLWLTITEGGFIMGALRDRMLANMRMRDFSPKTIEAYLWHVSEFTRYFGRGPDLLGEEEVRRYLLYLSDERKLSWSSVNVGYSALKFFYVDTLHRDWQVKKIPRPKGGRRLPVVLSRPELDRLFSATSNMKHRMIFRTLYSSGLRISEGANLKPFHIESDSMQIRVEQGKGKKDRYTILSETVLVELRDYWRVYRPTSWLFFGGDRERPISVSTIQVAFQRAKKKPA
jgi:site-specific recombinase XerD